MPVTRSYLGYNVPPKAAQGAAARSPRATGQFQIGPVATSQTPYADMLGNIQREQQQFYDQEYRPLARDLVADVNSTSIVDAAKEANSVDRTAETRARSARMRQRLGVIGNPTDMGIDEYSAVLGSRLTQEGNINQARVAQQERNDAVRDEMINVSRGIATSSLNSALDAASAETNRNNMNANIRAQNDAAADQNRATIASMAIMAIMMM